jgi:hypothetical protein
MRLSVSPPFSLSGARPEQPSLSGGITPFLPGGHPIFPTKRRKADKTEESRRNGGKPTKPTKRRKADETDKTEESRRNRQNGGKRTKRAKAERESRAHLFPNRGRWNPGAPGFRGEHSGYLARFAPVWHAGWSERRPRAWRGSPDPAGGWTEGVRSQTFRLPKDRAWVPCPPLRGHLPCRRHAHADVTMTP